ncbi:MAG: hypothetical protein AB1Z98_25135 [Nannocystaceae bacterium]
MTYSTLLSITSVIAAMAILGPGLAVTPASATTVVDAPPASPASTMAGLCGLTAANVAEIVDHYDLDPDMGAVAQSLSTPFDCGSYGELCNGLTTIEARNYACSVWHDLDDGRPMTAVINRAVDRLHNHLGTCTPDFETCEEICDPYEVISCSGVLWNGACLELAACDYFPDLIWNVPFFEVLGPI